MGLAVAPMRDGRSHVDDPFDQLGLLQVRHRIVAALELGAGEVIAVLQRWDLRRLDGRSRLDGPTASGVRHGRLTFAMIAARPRGHGLPTAAAGWRSSRTRRIEWSATSTTVNSTPSERKVSPGSGSRPRAWKAKPPTVRKSPSVGRWRSEPLVQLFERERGVDLVARVAERDDRVGRASGRRARRRSAPTSSSSRSSSVTRPATPPYSSSTIAIWRPRGPELLEQLEGVLGLGDAVGRADELAGDDRRRGRPRRSSAGKRSLA